ncbi:hypothetical protein SEVIR_9G065733v4 [Setaria viridis]
MKIAVRLAWLGSKLRPARFHSLESNPHLQPSGKNPRPTTHTALRRRDGARLAAALRAQGRSAREVSCLASSARCLTMSPTRPRSPTPSRPPRPLAVGGEAELHGRAERRSGLPQRHRRQCHGVRERGRPGLLLARAVLLGPDAGLDPQDALLEVVVHGGRLGGGRALLVGRCFRGVLAGGGHAGRERQ